MFQITCGTTKLMASTAAEAIEKAGPFYAAGKKPTIVELKEGKALSEFGHGKQVIDPEARERIEKQQTTMRAAGMDVGEKKQAYANGTRMAQVGYDTQVAKALEHNKLTPIGDAVAGLVARVQAEQRLDIVVRAGDLADKIEVNGVLKLGGRVCREAGLRGILQRIESPSWGYLSGLRNRISINASRLTAIERGGEEQVSESALRAMMLADKNEIHQVLQHELTQNGDTEIKLRTRLALNDIFGAASPRYAAADAPEAVGDLLKTLPGDARGSFAYDPISTSWSVRAAIWTPTPAQEQAVGEAFEAGVEFRSSDIPGASKFRGGGFANVLACLNASFYTAAGSEMERNHIGKILADIEKMTVRAGAMVGAILGAWGEARGTKLEAPLTDGARLSREIELAGFFRGMLTDRKAEMVRVLPGRVEANVEKLVEVYGTERRNKNALVKADLWQSFTKYSQAFDAEIRRSAEHAAGRWLVDGKPRFVGADDDKE